MARGRRQRDPDPQEQPSPPEAARRATRRTSKPPPPMATSVMPPSSGAPMPKTRRGRQAAHPPQPPTSATATAPTPEAPNATRTTAVPPPNTTGVPASNAPSLKKDTQTAPKRQAPDSAADTSRKRARKAGAGDTTGPSSVPHPTAAHNGPEPASIQTQPAAAGAKPSNTNGKSSKKPKSHGKRGKAGAKKTAGRNIDKVVLGDLCFRTWYPSYYPKEVLGEPPATASSSSSTNIAGTSPSTSFTASTTSPAEPTADGTSNPVSERDGAGPGAPMLDRLYVCPCCFKYSKELVMWWEHVQVCRARNVVPGHKIYVHPRGARTEVVPAETNGKVSAGRGKKKSEDPAAGSVVRTVEDQGEWSIWQVDGEDHVLFCQNLSLFAKLFLDNKSVFFDVTGFNYFLLVHSRPSSTLPSSNLLPSPPPAAAASNNNHHNQQQPAMEHHICGFFSKEKLSWDSNNLACILVFPPWQRKGLGALLMGASYEISRMEGVMGGPEKPISALGRKGYRRFWAGEVARWLLSLDTSGSSDASSSAAAGGAECADVGPGKGEIVVDVMDCSRATWIAPEDCLYVLREMNVARDDGLGPPKPTTPEKPDTPVPADDTPDSAVDDADLQDSDQPTGANTTRSRRSSSSAGTSTQTNTQTQTQDHDDAPPPELVPRVRIDKADVAAWVAANKVNLARPCVAGGFLPEFVADMERVKAVRSASSE